MGVQLQIKCVLVILRKCLTERECHVQTWGQIHASVFELQIQILHMSQIQTQIEILPFMSVFQIQIQILIVVFEIPSEIQRII